MGTFRQPPGGKPGTSSLPISLVPRRARRNGSQLSERARQGWAQLVPNSHDLVGVGIAVAVRRSMRIYPVLVDQGMEIPSPAHLPENTLALPRLQARSLSYTRGGRTWSGG